MSEKTAKIEGTVENWEDGTLGCDEQYARVSTSIDQKALDEALELKSISIRLQKGLLEDLKAIASMHGIGYQPLIKQVLRRFADAEMKQFFREHAAEIARQEDAEGEIDEAVEAEPVAGCG